MSLDLNTEIFPLLGLLKKYPKCAMLVLRELDHQEKKKKNKAFEGVTLSALDITCVSDDRTTKTLEMWVTVVGAGVVFFLFNPAELPSPKSCQSLECLQLCLEFCYGHSLNHH